MDSASPTGLPDLAERLDPELRGGDDRDLWFDVAARVAADVVALDAGPATPPRHVLLALARVPRHRAGVHPDERATLHLAWERSRGDAAWTFAGARPRVRSRHGSYTATVCIPAGTAGLAWVDAVVLWRPRLPWAPPEDHETGRETYRYLRGPDGSWRYQERNR